MQQPKESNFSPWKEINPRLALPGSEIDYMGNRQEVARIFETRGLLVDLLTKGPVVVRGTARPSILPAIRHLSITDDERTEYFHSPQGDGVALYYPIGAGKPRKRRTAYGERGAIVGGTRDIFLAHPSVMENPIRGSKPDGISLEEWYEMCAMNPKSHFNPHRELPPALMTALEGQFGHVNYELGTLAIYSDAVMLACDNRENHETESALLEVHPFDLDHNGCIIFRR